MHSETNSNSQGGIWGETLPPAWPEPSRLVVRVRSEGTVHAYRRAQRRGADRLIAVGIAAAVHVGVLFGIRAGSEPEAPPVIEPDAPIILAMPVLEPPEIIDVVDVAESTAPPEMAPPSLMDVPATIAVSTFVQPMSPQIDPALTRVGGIKIPAMTGNFGQPGAAPVRLFDLKDLDRVPRRLHTVVPVYPFDMRRAGIMGEVELLVIIDPSGHVEVVRVLSATNPEFAAAATTAAEQCVFESPLKGGKKVSARYSWRIPFELR